MVLNIELMARLSLICVMAFCLIVLGKIIYDICNGEF